jgi:hypothetical protein
MGQDIFVAKEGYLCSSRVPADIQPHLKGSILKHMVMNM